MKNPVGKAFKYMGDPKYRFQIRRNRGDYDSLPDEEFIRKEFKAYTGLDLNLEAPETFTEKLQWLKLHDRDALHTTLVDKAAVKDHVAGIIGAEHVIPTLGVYDVSAEVDFDALPDRFVLKCTHNSGLGMCICTDKSALDAEETRSKLGRGLAENYYLRFREWPYKNVPHRILAEQYMEDPSGELKDYKIHCFNGEPKFVQVIGDRDIAAKTATQRIYDFDWNDAGWTFGTYPKSEKDIDRPQQLDQMRDFAARLSAGLKYVRIDLYEIGGTVYFGEYTFFPKGGCYAYNDEYTREIDMMLGDLISTL
ncbi:MAG: glycosyl transferase [Lachnospiraceae bacterium]|nr:glycosyl transferase [Lachnospiraceae bacterium]